MYTSPTDGNGPKYDVRGIVGVWPCLNRTEACTDGLPITLVSTSLMIDVVVTALTSRKLSNHLKGQIFVLELTGRRGSYVKQSATARGAGRQTLTLTG